MPSWIARLVELQPVGHGSGSFRTSNAFGAGPRLFGGLIAAQALAAAGATVDPSRLPQSLHAYFIRGGRVGVDVDYDVETTRDGRSFATRRVTASQEDVPIFEMLVSFHRPEETWTGTAPLVRGYRWPRPPPSSSPEGWMGHFETWWRLAYGRNGLPNRSGSAPPNPSRTTRWCGPALTFVSDIGMVSVARPPGRYEPGPGGAASLDHALWLHRPVDPHQWHCYDAVAVSHNDARGLAFGSISDSAGALVASVAQESLWRI